MEKAEVFREICLPVGTNQFLILSGYFQRTDQQIQHIYFNEMDVHLCSHLLYFIKGKKLLLYILWLNLVQIVIDVKKEFLTLDDVKQLAATPCDIPVLKSASLFA